ncbi:MAG: POTRA domain-containing protein [Blastocatellia bacterium]
MNKIFRTTILPALVLISLACFTTRARTQDKLVEDVELRGYKRISKEEILSRIKTKPGEIYNEQQAKRDFEEVIKIEGFDRANCKLVTETGPRGGVIVIFDLKEFPESPQTKKEEASVINLDELERAGARIMLSTGSNVMVEGAVYLTAGDTIIPMPGGGASGCFNPTGENAGKVERAKAKYAKLNAASQAK